MSFIFSHFVDTMEFTQKLRFFLKNENHHPTILTEWGKVTVY